MINKDDAFLKNLLSIYRVESKERIQFVSNQLLQLEKSTNAPERKDIMAQLYREMHSLKGASRAVNLEKIEHIFKYLEDVYAGYVKRDEVPLAEHLDVLHKLNNIVEALIEDENDISVSPLKEEQLCDFFNKLFEYNLLSSAYIRFESKKDSAKPSNKESHKEETVRISSDKVSALLLNAEEILTTRLNLIQLAKSIEGFRENLAEDLKKWEKIYHDKQHKRDQNYILWTEECFRKIEVELNKISTEFNQNLRDFTHSVDNLLDDTKRLLLWPFSTILNVMPRIVRELSHDLNKQIDLVVEGQEVEIDKRILEQMRDVILHLVRNAVDHGIEKNSERKKRSKPEHGVIKIIVNQISGNEISITVSDDGKGIDREALKRTAIKQGIIDEAYASTFTDEQALNLIYYSGVSTSEILTDLSGRGLGMAIIREKIEYIGGELNVVSEIDKGTTFTIKLPLTLATFKGLLINVSNNSFLIPTASIERILRVNPSDIRSVENTESIQYEGKAISLVWLSSILGIYREESSIIENESKYLSAIVVSSVDKKIAFIVNDILDEQEILVKNFSKPLIKVKNISAAVISNSGKPIPIINCADLLKSAHEDMHLAKKGTALLAKQKTANKKVLLVEDSFTTRTLLKNILELGGYQVSVASDGLDAWGLIRTEDFSMVLSDVEMPRMNGFQLTQKIRSDKKLSGIPVILITSRESQEDKEKGIDAGANAYLPKSTFDSGRLLEVMSRFSAL